MLILILLLYNPTTLVYPPFSHTMGYHRGTLSLLKLATGRNINLENINGISAVKLDVLDDPKTSKDNDELTVFVTDVKNNSILYNIGFDKLGIYKSPNTGEKSLWEPADCEAMRSGTLWVVDRMNNRFVEFFFNGRELEFVKSTGRFGLLDGCFDLPEQIAVTKNKVFVTDTRNDRVQVFNHRGKYLYGIHSFKVPTGIAAVEREDDWIRSPESFIAVVDSGKMRLKKMTEEGNLLNVVTVDEVDYNFVQFEFIAIDYYGFIWVTDSHNHCVHLFNDELELITSFGRRGTGDKEFIEPGAISIWRRYGQVFIADKNSVQYFWIGVDAWIKGVEPGVFKSGEGVSISYYITQPSDLKVEIYNSSGDIIREMEPERIKETGKNYLLWDTLDEKGRKVSEGRYRIRFIFNPTYSSRGRFEKEIEVEVYCSG